MRRLPRALLVLPLALPACVLSLDGLSNGTTGSTATTATDPGGGGSGAVGGSGASGGSTATAGGGGGSTGGQGTPVTSDNPVIGQDHADPMVLRRLGQDGKASYVLATTIVGADGDMPVFTSDDLIYWKSEGDGLFHRKQTANNALHIGSTYFCNLWSPAMVQLGPSSYLMAFTATRFQSAQTPCPGYADNSGIYVAHGGDALGPFATDMLPEEPVPLGPGPLCPSPLKEQTPASVDFAAGNCGGGQCDRIPRTHADFFVDEKTGKAWMAYGWFPNIPPVTQWEKDNYGGHVALTAVDPADPGVVQCTDPVTVIHLANPHDQATLDKLKDSCQGCDQMLSNTRDRQGNEMTRDGHPWGLVERPTLFRRGDWVYALLTGSNWDSPYGHVYWVAAKTVEGLSLDSPNGQLIGRYLIPSDGQGFGGGSVVLGPDGASYYYVHNHLDSGPCIASGKCDRNVWVSPIEFEDRGDGLGDVWIKPRRPADDPSFTVLLP